MGYSEGNIKLIKTDVFNRICAIADTPSAEILLANLIEEFGTKNSEELIANGAFTHSCNRQDIDIVVDDEVRSYPLQMNDGAMSYFSPGLARWIPVNADEMKAYKVNFSWLLDVVISSLAIDGMTPVSILDENIWFIGSAWLKKRETPIIFVRNIIKQAVIEKLGDYLKEKHKSTPALILILAKSIPSYFHIEMLILKGFIMILLKFRRKLLKLLMMPESLCTNMR